MNKRSFLWLAAGASLMLAAPAVTLAQARPQSSPARVQAQPQAGQRWSAEAANAWYAGQPWLVGANFQPSTAINQLEMFQAETFDPATIDRELGWAKQVFGMNVMRVYLHDLLWKQDPQGFKRRLDQYLDIAEKHGIRTIFVLFDSCWDPDPQLGPQRQPVFGVHNSGWVQTPGRRDLLESRNDAHFRAYVQGVVGAFAKDPRVLAWDIWNEPDNDGGGAYEPEQLAGEKRRIAELLPQAFAWARSQRPVQPLTSGLWIGEDWSPNSRSLNEIQRIQVEQSDIITFHNYDWPESFEARIRQLRLYGRPIICTEWMARGNGSTVDTILPIARRENIGMVNWGFVAGDTQTIFPWDSWERPYVSRPPTVWFHDLLRPDGSPYREREVQVFRQMGAWKGAAAGATSR
ncbi:MAG TPA: cellulase family glycosylhydrolase [Caulobacteraceae bacterium]|jgi:hypothetical protein